MTEPDKFDELKTLLFFILIPIILLGMICGCIAAAFWVGFMEAWGAR